MPFSASALTAAAIATYAQPIKDDVGAMLVRFASSGHAAISFGLAKVVRGALATPHAGLHIRMKRRAAAGARLCRRTRPTRIGDSGACA